MIYLDNAATSFPKPESVYHALDRFARVSLANPGRAGHKMALAAEHTLDDARHRLNKLLNGTKPERFLFTLNGTDALNMAIKGVLHDGDHVVTSDLEHNSVSRPLVALQEAGRITLTRVKADSQGLLDPAAIKAAIRPRTRLVAITHAGNVLGTVQPIREIGTLCKEFERVYFLVDAAQTAGVVPIDISADKIDLLAFPGHKGLLGPTGTGALYVAPQVSIRPWREGGTGGDSSSPTQPKDFPHYLEGGTPNVLGIAGLVAGIAHIETTGLETIRAHEVGLCDRLRDGLEGRGFTFFGTTDPALRVGTIAFRTDAIAAAEIGAILDQAFDIAVRAGLHCAPYIHKALGSYPDGLVRVSPGLFTTADEIDRLIEALKEITAV